MLSHVSGEGSVIVIDLPLGRLSTPDIRGRLLGLLAQASSAVGVLFPNCLAIGQILGAVDYENECSDLRAIYAHVGEDACRVHGIQVDLGLGRHSGRSSASQRQCRCFGFRIGISRRDSASEGGVRGQWQSSEV